jgi:hypothetical protein
MPEKGHLGWYYPPELTEEGEERCRVSKTIAVFNLRKPHGKKIKGQSDLGRCPPSPSANSTGCPPKSSWGFCSYVIEVRTDTHL